MKNFLLLVSSFVCFCCAHPPVHEDGDFQSWVSDPQYSLYPVIPNVSPQSKNETCRFHSRLFLQHLHNKTLWATQMWDSSARAPVGVFGGNIYEFGNFDECLKVDAPFQVQFCIVHVFANISSKFWNFHEMEEPISVMSSWAYVAKSRIDTSKVPRDVLSWGLCTPAACSSSELQEAINSHLKFLNNDFFNDTTFRVRSNEDFCTQVNQPNDFSSGSIAFCVVTFTLILLTVTSTFMDFMPITKEVKQSKSYRMWMYFSVKQNQRQLFPYEPRTKNALNVFHGIKFLSIVVIVYGHRVGVSLVVSALNYDDIEDNLLAEHKMFFLQSDLVVDNFFFISGLLAAYFLMEANSQRFVNPLLALFVRIFRLAPLYFFVIWYQSTIAFHMGSGPLWNALAKNETQFCLDNWWANVLFVNNYVKVEEMCMPHSWFLPCEVHFFIMTACLVPLFMRYPKFGQIFLAVITIISAIIPSITIYINNTQPLILFFFDFYVQPRLDEVFNTLYIKSHNRATVYLIGVAVGLYLHHSKNSKRRISGKILLCGVVASLAVFFAPMAYGGMYYDINRPYNAVESAVFGSLRRILWAIGLAIFILVHRFGTIPVIDLLLSSKVANFLSRVTYGVYLVHFNFITSEVLTSRSSQIFSVKDVILDGFGDILKSVLVSVIFQFILEIPLKRCMREVVFAKKIKKFEKPQENQNVFTVRL